MAYMATPHVVLKFGDCSVEVPAAGGIAELQAKAEAEFDLHPDSYNFFDACGKVESAALQRVFRMAGDSPCALEVRERAEWKKIRELEARIEAIASQPAQQTGSGLQVEEPASIESRVLGKVEAAFQELGSAIARTEAKVDGALAPVIKSLALAQIDVKAQLDDIDAIALKSRLDTLEEQVTSYKMSSPPKDVPACRLDLAAEQDVWQKYGALGGRAGAADAPEGRRSPAGCGKAGQLIESLPGISGAKGWQRGLKVDADWGESLSNGPFARAAPRQLDRKLVGSRSSPHLPPVF